MACLAVADLPSGTNWEYELKFDGYRAIGFKTRGRIHLMSRNGKDFSRRFPTLARALEALLDETAVDGELVALDATGRPSFNLLQNYTSTEYSWCSTCSICRCSQVQI
jgi:bifunctional non-homologous end joining protein LigD